MRNWASSSHLLVYDPPPIGLDRVGEALARKGHRISRCEAVEGALALLGPAAGAAPPDLLLIRQAEPTAGGLDLLVRVRRVSRVPIVLHGAPLAGSRDRVAALELGADDHLDPRMALPELVARIQAVLRRAAWGSAQAAPRAVPAPAWPDSARAPAILGGWRLVAHRRAVVRAPGGETVALTGAEFELLRLLSAAHGEPVDREAISRVVFRRAWRVEDRAVDGLVKRVRRKLRADAIATVRGVGYALRYAEPLPEPLPTAAGADRTHASMPLDVHA
jgi:DNA-binding response OmpR family regulator